MAFYDQTQNLIKTFAVQVEEVVQKASIESLTGDPQKAVTKLVISKCEKGADIHIYLNNKVSEKKFSRLN